MRVYNARKPFYAGKHNPFGWEVGTWGIGIAKIVVEQAARAGEAIKVIIAEHSHLSGKYLIQANHALEVGKYMPTKSGKETLVIPISEFKVLDQKKSDGEN